MDSTNVKEYEPNLTKKKKNNLLNFFKKIAQKLGLKNWICEKLIFCPPNPSS